MSKLPRLRWWIALAGCLLADLSLQTPWTISHAGMPGTSLLPIVEDFEGSIDPGLYLSGKPTPAVSGNGAAIYGAFSLSYPCKHGDDPVTTVHPVPLSTVSIGGTFSLWRDCHPEGATSKLVQLSLSDSSQEQAVACLQLKREGNLFWVSTSVATDSGTSTASSWLPLDSAVVYGEPFSIELLWKAAETPSSQDGRLTLDVRRSDGAPMVAIDQSGIDNDSHLVGQIEIGVIGSRALTGAPRAMVLDDLTIHQ